MKIDQVSIELVKKSFGGLAKAMVGGCGARKPVRRLHIVKRVILRHRPSKPNMAMKNAMNNKSNNKVTHFTYG